MDEKEIKYLIDGIDVPYILIRFPGNIVKYDCNLTDEEAATAAEVIIKVFHLEFEPATMSFNPN